MFARYSQSMSYVEAARLTFTADNLCDLCEIVASAKQDPASDQPAPASAGTQKILLALSPLTAITLPAPGTHSWSLSDMTLPEPTTTGPPVPPPRA